MHCDLRVRWKVASDLRFRAAISEPKTPSFCGISGDSAPSPRKSLAIAIARFWCPKGKSLLAGGGGVTEKRRTKLKKHRRTPELSGHSSCDRSEYVNVFGVISDPVRVRKVDRYS